HQHVALRIRDDLRGVKRVADVLDELRAVSGDLGPRAFELLGGGNTLFLQGGDATGVNRFADQSDRNAEIHGGDDRPFAGALLAGGIENLVHHRLAVGVLERENGGGNLDEIGIEFALVPFGEDLGHFVGGHAETVLHQLVGFADEFHVAIFNAVVDHLDVVTGAVLANPVATGRAVVHLGGDGLEDGFDVRPGCRRPTGHDRWTMAGAFLAPGNTGADVEQALGLDVFGAAGGVLEKRVAAV